jgi:3-isopropylmalate/(R)-2-methylmalate dehydratase small subunit
MIVEGTAVIVPGDNVDTDVLYPGQFLNELEPEQMRSHLFEGLDPGLRDLLVGDTVLVVGENFGMGSSREHVPQAMRAAGVRCVLGRSFARIFQRNCVNLGLLVLAAPEAAAAARPGSRVRIDTGTGAVDVDGRSFAARPVPRFMLDMIGSGGLVPWAQRRLAAEARKGG